MFESDFCVGEPFCSEWETYSAFRELQGALQVRYRQLRIDGVGAFVKHSTIVTPQEETMLWETKVTSVRS